MKTLDAVRERFDIARGGIFEKLEQTLEGELRKRQKQPPFRFSMIDIGAYSMKQNRRIRLALIAFLFSAAMVSGSDDPQTDAPKLTLRTCYGSTSECDYMIRDIFVVWWDKNFDYSEGAENLLDSLTETRRYCLETFAMADPKGSDKYYYNVYIHNGKDLFPDGWAQGQGTDEDGYPYLTIPSGLTDPDYKGHVHEGFHIYQYNANSPGFDYRGDSQWFIEATANWFVSIKFPEHIENFLTGKAVTANPQVPIWYSFRNKEPGDARNWQRDCHQYGMNILLFYLTEVGKVPREKMANGFYAETSELPQEYLYNQIGGSKMCDLYADWAVHTTADFDYLTPAQVKRLRREYETYGTPDDGHPIVKTYDNSGTRGSWYRPSDEYVTRSWGYNVYKIENSSTGTYTFHLDGDGQGSEGTNAAFRGRVVVVDGNNRKYHSLDMSNAQDGSKTVNVSSSDEEMYFVVAATPNHFTGNQKFSYQIKIDRVLATDSSGARRPLQAPERGFISSEPAKTWEQGLICGNGTIGANALSRPLDETIIFSHERLFMPEGDPVLPPLMAPHLSEIRNLIDQGQYKRATELAFEISEQDDFMYPDRFVPAFDLSIRMDAEGDVTDYMRSVNFQTGEATVQWADKRGVFERRLFVSRKDGVAVLWIKGPGQAAVNCRLKLEPREPSSLLEAEKLASSSETFEQNIVDLEATAEKSALTFRNGFAQAYPGSIQAVEGVAHVVVEGGSTTPDEETLVVADADRVLVLVDIQMIYDSKQSRIEVMKESLAKLPTHYDSLLERHARVHGELFSRMRLDLGGGADRTLSTEELLAKTTNKQPNRALVEKEFDAGRYNIISCTGELPPTLQGVWGGTYSPGWASDFTQNGNVPSAIASVLMGNMPELMLAYTSYIESIVPDMETNAERIFGARGIVLPSRTSARGYNNSLHPEFAGGFWVGGAPWAAHFFYDYYLYTGDKAFLADHALPFMEKTALFFEDYLYEGPDGKYIFSPTQSPENTPGNSDSQGSFNATMDVAAAKELLRNLIAASRELGVNQEKIPVWKTMLEKMPDYIIGDDGAVKEWLTPKLEEQHDHRHSSQLYPLYDGMPDEIAQDPELQAGFRRIVEIKLDEHYGDNSSGFMSFGVVQLGQAATSLGESELAYRSLVQLANRYWLHNLASMHNHRSLFNMDISGGMPAVIIKMLVASSPGRIQLLPARPAAWPSGAIEGVLCRGQIEIKRLHWEKGRILIDLISAKDQTVVVEAPDEIRGISVKKGDVLIGEASQKNRRRLTLPAGQRVALDIETK